MKSLILSAVALSSVVVVGGECPADTKWIDAALAKNSFLESSQMAKVMELRASGERLHDSGKPGDSVKALREAMQTLGTQSAVSSPVALAFHRRSAIRIL